MKTTQRWHADNHINPMNVATSVTHPLSLKTFKRPVVCETSVSRASYLKFSKKEAGENYTVMSFMCFVKIPLVGEV